MEVVAGGQQGAEEQQAEPLQDGQPQAGASGAERPSEPTFPGTAPLSAVEEKALLKASNSVNMITDTLSKADSRCSQSELRWDSHQPSCHQQILNNAAELEAYLCALQEFYQDMKDVDRENEVMRIIGAFKLNPFEQLNLKFDATPDDVRRQYRKASLMVHPDKCSHEQV